jgi:aminoglycoside phosphotransferase family enzyme/predicted kinase
MAADPAVAGRVPELVAAMLDPAFYPHRPESVELRETHASWVFLAGPLAYKVKKPVVLPFLDYGTPERRHLMCVEEVRLNRRLAPRYYLGVEAILRRDGRYSLGPEGDPGAVEHTIRMRRVPEERTLASLIERRALRPPELDAVGGRLADFHGDAPTAPPARSSPASLQRPLIENVETLEEIGPPALSRERIRAMRHFTEAFLAAREEQFVARAREGRVREGHGDLRAEHVIVADGIDVYDCVEFAPALRYIDVAADLAFLVMDLARLGSMRLADRLTASYRAAGGEPGDDSLLSFYAAYRAWVRSTVACVLARERGAIGPERFVHEGEASEQLDLGHRFAWRARLPLVVAICGVAASGKSELARRLELLSGLRHLSSDVTRKRLAGVAPTERAAPEHYSAEFSRHTYEELGRLTSDEVRRSGGAIVDATFRRRRDRLAFVSGLGSIPSPVFFVRCTAPQTVLRRRAQARARQTTAVSDASPEIVERQLGEFEPLHEVPEHLRAEIRTDRATEVVAVDLEAGIDALLDRDHHGPAE